MLVGDGLLFVMDVWVDVLFGIGLDCVLEVVVVVCIVVFN